MKKMNFAVLLLSTITFAQATLAADPVGAIYPTASIPDYNEAFVITGKAAETIYNKLEVSVYPDPYYGPSVFTKKGQGISCSFSTKHQSYSCEFSVIKSGIDPR